MKKTPGGHFSNIWGTSHSLLATRGSSEYPSTVYGQTENICWFTFRIPTTTQQPGHTEAEGISHKGAETHALEPAPAASQEELAEN